MDTNGTKLQPKSKIEHVLSSNKWRPAVLLVIILAICCVLFGIAPSGFLMPWILTRNISIAVFAGLAMVIPPKDIRLAAQQYVFVVGPVMYAITTGVLYLGHFRVTPVEPKFYEVCALILPILILAIVIDAHLFTNTEAQPLFIFLNLAILAGGEGASLYAVSLGSGSIGLFANVVGTIVAAFAIIVASVLGKVPVQTPPNDSINALTRFLLWLQTDGDQTDKQSLAPSTSPTDSRPGSTGHVQSGTPEEQVRHSLPDHGGQS